MTMWILYWLLGWDNDDMETGDGSLISILD
jgi:hypothetical protein